MLFFNAICRREEVTNPAPIGMNQLTYDVRFLDSGTIRDWIREWYTKLNDVRASLLHREQNWHGIRDCGVPCGHESDQSRAGLQGESKWHWRVFSIHTPTRSSLGILS